MYNLHVLAPVFSENSVDQVSKEKGISRAQRLGTAKESFLRQGGEELESLRRVLVQARTEGSRPGENRSNFGAKRTRERFRAEKEKTIEAVKLKDDVIYSFAALRHSSPKALNQFYLPLYEDEMPIYRTTSTGTLELRTTLSATLPRRNRSRPEAPM